MTTQTPSVPPARPADTPNNFKIHTYRGEIRFLRKAIQPPSQVYVALEDDLVVSAATSTISETVTCTYRLLRFDGEVVEGQFILTPLNNRIPVLHTEPLTEGFLLSLSFVGKNSNRRGITFVRAFLTNASQGQGVPTYVLMADYITSTAPTGYPGGRIIAPTEGPGVIYPFTVANPPAGVNWNAILPANIVWRILSITATLQTSVAAGNRTARVLITNGSFTPMLLLPAAVQAPNIIQNYTWAQGLPFQTDTVNDQQAPLPTDCRTTVGFGIESAVANLQAGDQWSNIVLWVEEWLESV